MKLSSRDAQAFLKSPNPATALVLLYGPDAMRTAITRQDFMITLLGENAEEDMRLTRFSASEALAEPPIIQDAIKAIGFFPGPRGVLITEANDRIAPIVTDALSEWQDGDATLVIEAGNLRKTSALRKLAEKDPRSAAIALYPRPSQPSAGRGPARAGRSKKCAGRCDHRPSRSRRTTRSGRFPATDRENRALQAVVCRTPVRDGYRRLRTGDDRRGD